MATTSDDWTFWALPAGLRPVEGAGGESLDALLAALAEQATARRCRAALSPGRATVTIAGPWWRRARVEIADGRVRVTWRDGLRRGAFDEPLDAYAGVARWEGAVLRQIPLLTWPRRWWVVGLVHRARPGRTVPLAVTPRPTGLPALQAEAAKNLGVPVLLERPDGSAWTRLPAAEALRPLGRRLAEAADPTPSPPLPLALAPPPGGARAWGQEVVDRWLALLLLPPALSFLGGWPLMLAALALPLGVYVALLRWWHRPDSLTVEPDGTLHLSLPRRFGGRRTVTVPPEHLLALRLDASTLEGPCLVIEGTDGLWRVRLGGLDGDGPARLRRQVLTGLRRAEE